MKDETDPNEETKHHFYTDESSSFSYKEKMPKLKRKTLNVKLGINQKPSNNNRGHSINN